MQDEARMRAALEALATEVTRVNDQLASENIKRDERISASEKVQRENRWLAIVGGIIAICAITAAALSIAFGIQAHNRVVDICKNGNTIRTEITGFVSDLTASSSRSAQATLASPTTSAEQKATATRNLKSIQDANEKLKQRLALKDC